MSTLDRYRDAIAIGHAFWEALADDDEDALAPLLSPVWDGRPPGFAAIYRASRELALETCRFLGLATHAELLVETMRASAAHAADGGPRLGGGRASTRSAPSEATLAESVDPVGRQPAAGEP